MAATTHDSETARTTPELARLAARRHGERVAFVDGEREVSFADLNRLRERACAAFIASGVARGDRVAIWAPNSLEWIVAALGLQSAGAVLVTVNTRLKGEEAAYILNHSGARMLVTTAGFLDIDYLASLRGRELPALGEIAVIAEGGEPPADGALPPALSWETFMARGEEEGARPGGGGEVDVEVGPEDTLDMMFTSGTTGSPKGVLTAHGQNLRTFDVWSATVGLVESDVYLIINPFFHSFGYKAGWLSCLIRGCKGVLQPTFDVERAMAAIERERVTVLPGPPTIYHAMLASPERARYDLSSLRLAVTGAASVPVRLVERIRDELGFAATLTAYGLTESCGVVSICAADDPPERVSSTSGKRMPGVEIKCVDARGETVGAGQPGELCVRGFNVMRGYFNAPEETAKAIDEQGWLRTGDVAVIDEQGYVRITDRIKDMYICGGFNCYPAEIENMLCAMPGVAQAAVIGTPDERMGEVGFAFVVPAPIDKEESGGVLNEAAILAWCRERMANYKAPRHARVVEALPVNASGKTMKNTLRQWVEDNPSWTQQDAS